MLTFRSRGPARSPAGPRLSRRDRILLAMLCTAQVLEALTVAVVIVALPAIRSELGLTTSRLQLVVTIYAVIYGGLLLASGRVADVVDRRLVFAAGLVLTLVGAFLCAFAPTISVLLVGRAVQGLGGAVITPAAMSLVTASFPAGRPRGVAVSAWTAAAAGGGALGYLLAGRLVDHDGWRAVFWLLTPVPAAVLFVLWWVVPRTTPQPRSAGLGLVGAATVTAGLVLLVLGAGLMEDGPAAVVPPAVPIVVGLGLLGLFLALQRHGRAPLIRWDDLTDRRFLTANGATFVTTATTSAAATLIALVAADVLHFNARATGLLLLPFSVVIMLGSTTGSFWLRRRLVHGMATGLGVVALAMIVLALATAARSALGLAVGVAVAGLGLSWSAVTSTSAAIEALPVERHGVASAAINTAAQIGTALGVAVLLAIAGLVGVDGRMTGYVVAFVVAAGIAATYTVALLISSRRSDRPRSLQT